MTTQRFEFAFDPRFRVVLALIGIRPATCRILLDDESLHVDYGRWRIVTPIANIEGVEISGGYRWYRAIGPRGSAVDHGATFGTNTSAGVCVRFREPVPGLFGRRLPHPGLTVTVEHPESFADAVRHRIGG